LSSKTPVNAMEEITCKNDALTINSDKMRINPTNAAKNIQGSIRDEELNVPQV
jgi:hypothetical protein